jgi:DNA polymerase IV
VTGDHPGGVAASAANAAGVDEVGCCTVLHVDMDAFFAAVEVLDDPTLAGRPVIVGGTGARGVVASCSYEARAFGIHSAMPALEARRRCPHAVFLEGRFARYVEMSERFHAVLRRFSPAVEGIALDEAFVDIAGARRRSGSPPQVAEALRRTVRDELSMDCAVGVARTKLLAKLASRAAKPVPTPRGPVAGPGVVVVLPSQELSFLHPLPVRALWGVGPATARRLVGLGVTTIGDLAAVPEDALRRSLGSAQGRMLAELARGEDPRRVEPNREAKSVGHEETFARDLHDHTALHRHVVRMADAVGARLREAQLAARTVTVKVRFGDRSTITRSHTLETPVDSARAFATVAGALLDGVDVAPGVRLLGVSVSGLQVSQARVRQLSFEASMPRSVVGSAGAPDSGRGDVVVAGDRAQAWAEVEAAVGAIRARYGNASVGPATLAGRNGLAVKQRGDTQWGPSADQSETEDGR